MSDVEAAQNIQKHIYLERLGLDIYLWAGIAGVAVLGVSIALSYFLGWGQRFFYSYLVNYVYFLSLSLGALFFVSLQHLTRSGWSVTVRRIAEIFAANSALMAVLFIPIFIGMSSLYPWTNHELVAHDALLQGKQPYLNIPFFVIRCLFYFASWIYLSQYFLNRSLEQDKTGDANLTLRMERLSAPGMALFALTITFAAFDWLMSLDPRWFSTIYGVYFFTGCVVGFIALLAVTAFLLQSSGRLTGAITIEHYHDLGKLLFGFIFFWGYIAFSQYMLIWYANLPEETGWIFRRTDIHEGQWGWVGLILFFGHFIIPFLGLISRYPKRRKRLLVFWAVWALIAHWLDLYWLVMPEYSPQLASLHLLDITCFIGIGGLYFALAARIAKGRALLPIRDPRLEESLNFENA
ncbi:MAG: quinol:cytochrome C oxidoreductase [Candidatus Omnitrophota bacterium]